MAVLCHACIHGYSQGLPAIRLLNNFVLYSPVVATLLAREEVFLFALFQMLKHSVCQPVQKEAALLLTNLAAVGGECRTVIASNSSLLEAACVMLESGSGDVQKEATFAVLNLVLVPSRHQQGFAARVSLAMALLLRSEDRELQAAALHFYRFLADTNICPKGLDSVLPVVSRMAEGGEAAAAAVLEVARAQE